MPADTARSTEILSELLDITAEGVVVVDEDSSIHTVNNVAANIFGYTPEVLIGLTLPYIFPELQNQSVQHFINKAGRVPGEPDDANIRRVKNYQLAGKTNNGNLFPCSLTISRVDQNRPDLYLCLIKDVSEIEQIRSDLLESTNRINAIIDNAVDGIITINERGIIEMINPAVTRLFGYYSEELIGENVKKLMLPEDGQAHDQYLINYLTTRKPKIIGIGREVTGRRKDGSTFPFNLSVSEVELSNRKIFTGIVHDLSEQKLAEENLRRYAAELERSNRELQDFAYVSSHDLQEPLRKIQAFGDRIKSREKDQLSERGQEYLERMLNAAKRMQNLINDLLTYSRVTTQAKPFKKVNLKKIVEEVVNDLEYRIEHENASVFIDDLPEIEADAVQIRQLFQNLLSNALKFRKQDVPPEIHVSYQDLHRYQYLHGTPGDDMIEITVKDNGIGFDDKYADRIFNVFQRLEGNSFEGSGVGLAICKKIVVRHGGDITVSSKPGKGTSFKVQLATQQT